MGVKIGLAQWGNIYRGRSRRNCWK